MLFGKKVAFDLFYHLFTLLNIFFTNTKGKIQKNKPMQVIYNIFLHQLSKHTTLKLVLANMYYKTPTQINCPNIWKKTHTIIKDIQKTSQQ